MAALLTAKSLTVRFSGLTAVNNVDMAIEEGQIHGLIGPNGAGKSTFFNALSGVVKPTSGSVIFDGKDITNDSVHRRAAFGMRRTFQHVQLMQERTTLENVLVGMHLAIPANPLKSIIGWGEGFQPDRKARERAREVLAYLGLESVILRPVGALTIAEQRLIELARALVMKPKILMLDEPCAGLSPPAVEQLDKYLVRLRKEWGLTILLIEHVISLVVNVCDRITVLDNGKKIAEGKGMDVMSEPAVRLAYLGAEEA